MKMSMKKKLELKAKLIKKAQTTLFRFVFEWDTVTSTGSIVQHNVNGRQRVFVCPVEGIDGYMAFVSAQNFVDRRLVAIEEAEIKEARRSRRDTNEASQNETRPWARVGVGDVSHLRA